MSASNEDIYKAVLDVNKAIGRIEAKTENNHEFIKAVSAKTDAVRVELNTHKDTVGAHGVGIEQKTLMKLGGGIVGVFAVMQGVIEIFRWYHR